MTDVGNPGFRVVDGGEVHRTGLPGRHLLYHPAGDPADHFERRKVSISTLGMGRIPRLGPQGAAPGEERQVGLLTEITNRGVADMCMVACDDLKDCRRR